jgi:hypothetical protein
MTRLSRESALLGVSAGDSGAALIDMPSTQLMHRSD